MANNHQVTHVLLIVHVSHQNLNTSFGFCGDEWISAHIEVLRPTVNDIVVKLSIVSISDIFKGQNYERYQIDQNIYQQPPYRRLYKYIQASVSVLKDCTAEISTNRINILVELIPENLDEVQGMKI